jgi:uracil-DNA glycosylase
MNLGRQDRLKALGLWPVWRLRASPAAEPATATLADEDAPSPEQSVSPLKKTKGRPEFSCPPRGAGWTQPGPGGAQVQAAAPACAANLDWESLRAAVKSCSRCALSASRTQGVPGVGDPNAEWLFIGEAPGADEDRLGEPFVGQAGKLLDAMMAGIGLQRGRNVYIANILKSRPPGNRDPKPDEVEACLPYLERQIDLIKPKLIVVLGRIAAQTLLVSDTPIGKLRGHVHQYRGVPMVVTYHPAYLLRNPADKAKTWEDLVLARQTMQALKPGSAT